MNRAQRRKFNKQNKTNWTKEEFEVAIAVARLKSGLGIDDDQVKALVSKGLAHVDNEELVPNGTEVMLNYDAIMERPKAYLTEKFVKWVEENKDKVFHLFREDNAEKLVCLEEDKRTTEIDGVPVNEPRWLFDLYNDLLIQEDEKWISVWQYAENHSDKANDLEGDVDNA